MMNAVAGAHDITVQMIDTTIAGVHQHADPPPQRLADVPSPPSICWPINAIAR